MIIKIGIENSTMAIIAICKQSVITTSNIEGFYIILYCIVEEVLSRDHPSPIMNSYQFI